MDQQRIENSGDAVRLSAASLVRHLMMVLQKQLQVIPSSTAEEDRVPSHTRSTKGYRLEAGTAPRKS